MFKIYRSGIFTVNFEHVIADWDIFYESPPLLQYCNTVSTAILSN